MAEAGYPELSQALASGDEAAASTILADLGGEDALQALAAALAAADEMTAQRLLICFGGRVLKDFGRVADALERLAGIALAD